MNRINERGIAKIHCVFHRETLPSLRVEPDGDFFCYGCRAQGNFRDHPDIESVYRSLQWNNPQQLTLPGFTFDGNVPQPDPRPHSSSP